MLTVNRIKYWIKILLGQKMYFARQVRVNTMVLGNQGGAFPITPPEGIAGNPALSSGVLTIYSFGIGEDLSFSQGILDTFPQARIYAFDPTPKAIRYAENHPLAQDSRFTFLPYGISDTCGTETFYLPQNENYVSGSVVRWDGVNMDNQITVEMRTLSALMEQLGHKRIDILKMDIEGSEFRVIPQILESGCAFSQLCIEQHFRFFSDGKEKMRTLVKLLNQYGYYIADVLESGEELLFIKKEP